MTWLLTSIRLGRTAYKHNTAPSSAIPCGHVARSSPQLYQLYATWTIGAMEGKSITPFVALHWAVHISTVLYR